MHCTCCNKVLSDYEATRKHGDTGQYLDMCTVCLDEVQDLAAFPVEDNPTLLYKHNTEGEFDIDSLDID